ncbi:MAG: hypothetical protein ACOCYG_05950 [Spirochaetota bacterium]
MKRLAELAAQENRALDAYEGVIRTMRRSAEEQEDSVHPLDASFDAALKQLAHVTNRVVTVHSTLHRALADEHYGSHVSGNGAHRVSQTLDLDSLDARRAALLEEGRRLRELLRNRRDRMNAELQRVRVPARPRSVYGEGGRPSMIDVSG